MDKQLLTKPFPKERIKSREGRKGMIYYYIPVKDVIKRLNEVSDNVNIVVKDKIITEKETVVLVSLEINGIVKEAYGSSVINGSIGDSLKSSVSDGIRKAASYFGVPCIFHTEQEEDEEEEIDNDGEVGYRCSICNRSITKQVYNYSLNNYNKPLCIQHQRRFTKEDMVV